MRSRPLVDTCDTCSCVSRTRQTGQTLEAKRWREVMCGGGERGGTRHGKGKEGRGRFRAVPLGCPWAAQAGKGGGV